MRVPAEQYLALRAVGAPAVVVSLAVQGVFRGFKDTKTPLYATGENCYFLHNMSWVFNAFTFAAHVQFQET